MTKAVNPLVRAATRAAQAKKRADAATKAAEEQKARDIVLRREAEPVAKMVMEYLLRPLRGETAEAAMLTCMVQAVWHSRASAVHVLALCVEGKRGGPCKQMPGKGQIPIDRLTMWFERKRAEMHGRPPPKPRETSGYTIPTVQVRSERRVSKKADY